MPIRGRDLYLELSPLLHDPGGLEWFDAHTHMGSNDPDGVTGTPEEILQGLDDAGQQRALIFPMHEPGGYPPANDAAGEAARASGGRLRWLCRVAPDTPGAVDELRRCLAAGASGLKLHPRSDAFGLPHPVVDELVAVCAEQRRPVLFHAGRGIPNLGSGAVELARRFRTPIILAHAGVSDLGLLAEDAAALPNLFFDTSWWNASDMLQLLCTVPAGRILYASDMPYAPGLFASFILRRCAREVGLGADALRSIAGGQLARILDGVDPLDVGPAPGTEVLSPRSIRAERVSSYAGAAVQMAFRGVDCAETISLARLGAQHVAGDPDAALLSQCDALLARALEHLAAADGDMRAVVPATLCAHVLAGTPGSGATLHAV